MATLLKIEGVTKVVNQLNKHKAKAKKDDKAAVRVGYTAEYAVYVHEINLNYRNNKKWKYLENPTRQLVNTGELGKIITTAYKNGASLQQSINLAALRIQRESQLAVPIDTGHLRGSAFTRAGEGQ